MKEKNLFEVKIYYKYEDENVKVDNSRYFYVLRETDILARDLAIEILKEKVKFSKPENLIISWCDIKFIDVVYE